MIADDDFTELACTGLDEWRDEPADYRDQLEGWAARGVLMHCLNPDRVVIHCGVREACAGALADIYEALGGRGRLVRQAARADLRPCPAPRRQSAARAMLAIGDGWPPTCSARRDIGIDAVFVSHGIHAGEPVPADFAARHGLGDWRRS